MSGKSFLVHILTGGEKQETNSDYGTIN